MNNTVAAISSNNEVIELAFQKVEELVKTFPVTTSPVGNQLLEELMTIIAESIRTNRLACERLVKFVRNVRNFARLDEAEWKKADIHEGIESTLTLLAHELKGRSHRWSRNSGILRSRSNAIPISSTQVFMNIIVNCRAGDRREGRSASNDLEENSTTFVLRYRTTAGVFQRRNVRRIFEPGFTPRSLDSARGWALSICSEDYSRNHNGRIDVKARSAAARAFRIILPIARRARGKRMEIMKVQPLILIVDDEEIVTSSLREPVSVSAPASTDTSRITSPVQALADSQGSEFRSGDQRITSCPRMDGIAFLARFKESQPQAIRYCSPAMPTRKAPFVR